MNAPVPHFCLKQIISGASLSWACAFTGCGKTRIFEGGRPELFHHLDTCNVCGSRVARTSTDRAVIAGLIEQHLL